MQRFLRLVAIGYLSLCLLLFLGQSRLLYGPTRTFQKTPTELSLTHQEVWIPIRTRTGKIERLHSWWLPGNGSLGTMLYLHGRGFNIGSNINQAGNFQRMGFSVLLVDYRGYGRSEGGFPHEPQLYQDADAAWHYLVKQRRIPPSQITLYGHSLGGAIALDLAIKQPDAARLIVQSSFTSMAAMAARYPYLRPFPIPLLLTQRFNSLSKVRRLKVPVLFIHGTQDTLVPDSMGRQLYEAAPQPKQLLLIPNATHNNGDRFFNSQAYRQAVEAFVREGGDR